MIGVSCPVTLPATATTFGSDSTAPCELILPFANSDTLEDGVGVSSLKPLSSSTAASASPSWMAFAESERREGFVWFSWFCQVSFATVAPWLMPHERLVDILEVNVALLLACQPNSLYRTSPA